MKVSLAGRYGPWTTSASNLLPVPPPGDGLTAAQRKLIKAVQDGHDTYGLAALAVSTAAVPWLPSTVARVANGLVKRGKMKVENKRMEVVK